MLPLRWCKRCEHYKHQSNFLPDLRNGKLRDICEVCRAAKHRELDRLYHRRKKQQERERIENFRNDLFGVLCGLGIDCGPLLQIPTHRLKRVADSVLLIHDDVER